MITLPLIAMFISTQFDPNKYDKDGTIQQDRAFENLSGWTFNETDVVLDIGSGNGRITRNIADQVPFGKVIGLDIDPLMCEFANQNYNQIANTNLEFIVGDACHLNFNEMFDKIISLATLSWIPNEKHSLIFEGIFNALKPKGKALLRMSSEGKRPFNDILEKISNESKWSSYFEGFVSPAAYESENHLRSIISDAKLNILRIEDATKVAKFSNKKDFSVWLTTWLPHLKQIPKDFKEEFLTEVIQKYCESENFLDQIEMVLPGILVEVEKH